MKTKENETLQDFSNRFMCSQEKQLHDVHVCSNKLYASYVLCPMESKTTPFLMFEQLDSRPKILCSYDLQIRGGNNRIGYQK